MASGWCLVKRLPKKSPNKDSPTTMNAVVPSTKD